jgi:glycogen operon protein
VPTFTAFQPEAWPAASWPLGAHPVPDRGTTTFAVSSRSATRVVLELFAAPTGQDAAASFDLARGADAIWRAEVQGAGHGTLYGFRCWGPGWPSVPAWARGGSGAGFLADVDADGNRFDPNKLLFDPYARELSHEPASPALLAAGLDVGIYGTGPDVVRGRPRREHDTGPWAPKAIVIQADAPARGRPGIAPQDAAIYEAHVRNLTAHRSSATLRAAVAALPGFADVEDVPPALAGTFAGAAAMAPYLRALGFNTIELMPVQELPNGPAAKAAGVFNHWGYMTLAFFAPDREYAADRSPGGPTREFKAMVRAFHAAGIEVYLDVVFNHTAEGGNWRDAVTQAPRLDTVSLTSLCGLDTTSYYLLEADRRLSEKDTGCGNELDTSRPTAQALVLDALRYWIEEMGVDGFRFDLAAVLGRTASGFDAEHPLLAAIRTLGEAEGVEMIAEPWDTDEYELGRFPAGWGEWNGRFRDTVRGYLKGDGNLADFMAMVNGDYADFQDQGGPQRSVDFVAVHDGLTLLDLVSYQRKNNAQPPPFGPSDGGSDDERAWDSGGDRTLRRQRVRGFLAVLFLSRGVPLLCSGDELGRTQNGNNNPWALDGPAQWNNWAMAGTSSPTALLPDPADPAVRYHDDFGQAAGPADRNPLLAFTAFVAGFRRDHACLRQARYGNLAPDDADVSYLFTAPAGDDVSDLAARSVRLRIDGSGVGDCDLLVCVNMEAGGVTFAVPPAAAGRRWVRIVDTAAWAEAEANCWPTAAASEVVASYWVHPWSIAVLQEAGEPRP